MGKDGSFEDAQEKDRERLAKVKKQAEEKIKSKVVIEGLEEKLDKIFDSPFWDRVHQRCLGCAICTYLCSTCHCFALLDERVNSREQRVRSWDSCMFPDFTLEASGHNPRISNRERMRQRVMHKFNYFVKNFGETACVGCGRCIQNCPVNIDIREIIEEIENEQPLPS
jgi:ferredoxin